jgi:hypothetical protein
MGPPVEQLIGFLDLFSHGFFTHGFFEFPHGFSSLPSLLLKNFRRFPFAALLPPHR